MKYWLISQKLLKQDFKNDLLNSNIGDNVSIYIGNWLLDNVLEVDDITEENIFGDEKINKKFGKYDLIRFKGIKKGDKVLVVNSKKEVFCIGIVEKEIYKSIYDDNNHIFDITGDKLNKAFFAIDIKIEINKSGEYILLDEENKITNFKKTIDELKEESYLKYENIIIGSNNGEYDFRHKDKIDEILSKYYGLETKAQKNYSVIKGKSNIFQFYDKSVLFVFGKNELDKLDLFLEKLNELGIKDYKKLNKLYSIIDNNNEIRFIEIDIKYYDELKNIIDWFLVEVHLIEKNNYFNEENKGIKNKGIKNKVIILDIINFIINEKKQIITQENLYNILISLTVNNFLIFSGPSGTGKTSIIEKISDSINGKFYKLPIKSNFTDESSILGYWNPLLSRYEGTEALEFLIKSYKNPEQLHFLLLDEMNLSKVENYFSTFLSEIDKLKDYDNLKEENKPKITLFETNITNSKQYENIKYFLENYFGKNYTDYKDNIDFTGELNFIDFYKQKIGEYNQKDNKDSQSDSKSKDSKDTEKNEQKQMYNFETNDIKSIKVYLKLKNNLKIIGTINEDETTNSISNKVLDRSQFITFEVSDLFGENSKNSQITELLEQNFFDIYESEKIKLNEIEKEFKNSDKYEEIKKLINSINKQIQNISINESIGYRSIEEIMTYIKNYCDYDGKSKNIQNLTEALDNQISQKVLTKLKTFSLIGDKQKKAFEEIGNILGKLEYKELDKNGKEQTIKIKLDGKLEKSIKFYEHLKSNLF